MKVGMIFFICLLLTSFLALPISAKKDENLFLPLFYSESVNAYKKGNLDEALDYIDKSVSLKPNDVSNLILLAQFQLEKTPELSIETLQKALKFSPGDSLINFLLGIAYEKNNDLPNSLKYYKLVFESQQDNVLLLSAIGRIYFLMEEYDEAVKNLTKVVAVYPDNIKAKLILALSYHFLNEYNLAEGFYREVLSNLEVPTVWYNLAKVQSALSKYTESKRSITRAIELDALNLEFYLDRAEINYQLSLLEDAEKDYRQALIMDPVNPVTYVEYADFLWKTNAYSRAVEQLNKAAELQPHDIEIISGKAYLLQILGKIYDAGNAWKDILDIDPTNETALYNLAKLYSKNNEYNNAIDLYTKLLSLKLSKELEAKIKLDLAFCYRATGQFENAKHVYLDTLKVNADNPLTCYEYAKFLEESADYEGAVSYFKKSLELGFSDQKQIYTSLIGLYEKLNELEKINNIYKEWLAADEGNINARTAFANFLSASGDLKAAVEQYRVVAALDKSNESRFKLVEFLKKNGSLSDAVEELKEYLKVQPDNLNAYIMLANLYKELDRSAEAIEIYKKIILLQPGSYAAYFNLGLLTQKQGNLDEAKNYFLKTIEVKPDYSLAYYSLGLCYFLSVDENDESVAIKYFRQYLELSPSGEFSKMTESFLNKLQEKSLSTQSGINNIYAKSR